MAGYFIYSLDPVLFRNLTTNPTFEQAAAIADLIIDDLGRSQKWPKDPALLAKAICDHLAAPDWYTGIKSRDADTWDTILLRLQDSSIDLGFQVENDGDLWFETANIVHEYGVELLGEPQFGNAGYRCSRERAANLGLCYSIHEPEAVQTMYQQLLGIADRIETDYSDSEIADEFQDGLLLPVQSIAEKGRVMWVQTDT